MNSNQELSLEQLLKEGKISQKTYDKAYVKAAYAKAAAHRAKDALKAAKAALKAAK